MPKETPRANWTTFVGFIIVISTIVQGLSEPYFGFRPYWDSANMGQNVGRLIFIVAGIALLYSGLHKRK